MKKIIIAVGAVLLASSFPAISKKKNAQPQFRTLSYEEASAFEKSLFARDPDPIKAPDILFVQPVNKKEDCKLRTTQDQLDRRNFRAFWDGDCKNGYAFGLGRDIAISDTHHTEEITIYDGTADSYANQPWAYYDFVNNYTAYGVRGQGYPATSGINQEMTYPDGSIGMVSSMGKTDESGNHLAALQSPLNPKRIYQNITKGVMYRFTDLSEAPIPLDQATGAIEIVDVKSGVAGGVRIVRFRNGYVEHQKLDPGGQVAERIIIPQDYVNHLLGKVGEVESAVATANTSAQKAQQMEREYLYMACNGKHTIEGLDKATATKICTWRDQFKQPYEEAHAKYQQQMEQQRQQVAMQEQQRSQQQAQNLMLMQQLAQQQQQASANQQALQGINNSLQNLGNSLNNSIYQQNHNNSQIPYVAPPTPPGGGRVVCNTLSNGTVICK